MSKQPVSLCSELEPILVCLWSAMGQLQRRAARISGHNMVVTVYRTSDEWAFRAYDLTSCDDLRVAVNNKVSTMDRGRLLR